MLDRSIFKKLAVGMALTVPFAFLSSVITAPAAHAAVACVESGGNPDIGEGLLVDPVGTITGTGGPEVHTGKCPVEGDNLFEINVCVLEPEANENSEPDVPPGAIGGNFGVVEAWATGFPGTSPQGEAEVIVLGTDTGISSNDPHGDGGATVC
jgi:hypothetical protein